MNREGALVDVDAGSVRKLEVCGPRRVARVAEGICTHEARASTIRRAFGHEKGVTS